MHLKLHKNTFHFFLLGIFLLTSLKAFSRDTLESVLLSGKTPVETPFFFAMTLGSMTSIPFGVVAGPGPGLAISVGASLSTFILTVTTEAIDWHTSETDPLFKKNFAAHYFQDLQRMAGNFIEGKAHEEYLFEIFDQMDDFDPIFEDFSDYAKAELILALPFDDILSEM